MSYNKASVHNSADDEQTVNGNPYIDVAKAYYHSTMYSDHMGVVQGLFDEAIPVFNAVPKVVNIASALAIGRDIQPSDDDSEYVGNIIDKLALDQEKIFMTRDLILGKSILVEIQSFKKENDDGSSEDTNYYDKDFPYAMNYYPSDQYEVISEGNIILYAKISGVKLQLNNDGDGYDEIKIDKIYIVDNIGNASSYTMNSGTRSNEEKYDNGVLPLVEISTTYDMKQLFYAIDRHNELESFIRNILYLAGEPILSGAGVDKLTTDDARGMSVDNYKKLKALFTKNESAKIQMLEIKGSSAQIMIDKQKSIVEAIIKDYPEYSISEVLAGSNVSEETTKIRLTEILSRVSEVSKNMETGINAIISIISFLDGREMKKKFIKFGSMLDTNLKDVLDMVILAQTNGLISKRSAMYQIRDLYIGEDVDIELERLDSEGQQVGKVSLPNKIDEGEDKNGESK